MPAQMPRPRARRVRVPASRRADRARSPRPSPSRSRSRTRLRLPRRRPLPRYPQAPARPVRSASGVSAMLKGFKEFILRGNVIDLAVAVVIGAAFTGLVNAIVTSVFNPAIGALFNATSLETALPVTIPTTGGGTATMYFGAVIAALIQFLLVAIVVYFALIVPINYLKRMSFR